MTVKVTMANNSSDSVDFINATGTTLAQVKAADGGSSNGSLALHTTSAGTSSEKVRVDKDGNVGIGTSSPNYTNAGRVAVTINGSTDSVLTMNYGGTVGLYAQSSSTKGLISTTGSLPLALGTASTERVRVDSSGNVFAPYSSVTTSLVVGGDGNTNSLGARLCIKSPESAGASLNYAININDSTTNTSGGANLIAFSHNSEDYSAANVRASLGATIDGGGAGSLVFRTGGYGSQAERARIDSSGNLLVGRTSTGFDKTAYGWQLSKDAESFGTVNTASSLLTLNRNNTGDIFKFFRDGTQRGWISVETTGTTYGNLSDRREKQNFTDAPEALSKLNDLQVQSFDWKAGGHTDFGFIAQDLYEVLPFAVTAGDDGEIVEKPWGIDNSKIVPFLVKAIQEQQAQISDQQALIQTLTSRIEALENK